MEEIINVKGMTCGHCKMNVEKGIKTLKGVKKVTADLGTGDVLIEHKDADIEAVKEKIKELGYEL